MISPLRVARVVAIGAIETLSRGLFRDVPAISFVDRALIIGACMKVGQLMPSRNESDEHFARYEQAMHELASHTTVSRVLALASFRGMRDPAERYPVADWVDRRAAEARALLARIPSYAVLDDCYRKQATVIREAHLAAMRAAPHASLDGNLAHAIQTIAEQRDDLARKLEELAQASDEAVEALRAECDHLRAKLAQATPGPDEERLDDADESLAEALASTATPAHDDPYVEPDLTHVGAELHAKWKAEEEEPDANEAKPN